MFLDACHYLQAGWYSHTKYLNTYRCPDCEGVKSFFMYEYADDLSKLDQPLLPYETFYFLCAKTTPWKRAWTLPMGRKSMRDLLVYYYDSEVVPLLTALQQQCQVYHNSVLDTLKDLHCPGLGLHYGIWGSEGLFHTFGHTHGDLLFWSIIGGLTLCSATMLRPRSPPSKPWTMENQVPWCHALVVHDSNSLYHGGMADDQQVGTCLVRLERKFGTDSHPLPTPAWWWWNDAPQSCHPWNHLWGQ